MTDVLTPKQRSFNMSRIRAKHTKAEMLLRKALYSNGIRGYRIHHKLIGRPDIVFTKKKVAVFIDGCFWHKCPKCFIKPLTRTDFWMKKIHGNIRRDEQVNKELKKNGWKVLRIREHAIKQNPSKVVAKIRRSLAL